MVSIHNRDQNNKVKGVVNLGRSPTWIGLVKVAMDDSTAYAWTDGTSFDWVEWDSNEVRTTLF